MNFEKKNNIYKTIMVIIVTAIITFILTAGGMYGYYLRNDDEQLQIATNYSQESLNNYTKMIKQMETLKKYLNKYYIGDIEEDKMVESAIKGYIEGVGDPYTEYLTKSELEEFITDVNGDYVGIGVYLAQDKEGNILVLLPIEGSPAEEIGIKTGDIITKVNDELCEGEELDTIANKIKGKAGTKVKLEIQRDDQKIELEVERRKVEMKYIASEVLEGNIGYIRILAFGEDSSSKFEKELNSLMEKNIKSLIIDVRNNGGGVVESVLEIADLFTDKDDVLMIEIDKDNEKKETISKKQTNINFDIIVLTNENSASASEILAAALKDNGKAKILGTKTYGKGVMQEVIEIPSDGGAIKITIEEFLTPNGDKINEVGIEPDIKIELDEEAITDTQLEKAIEILK